MVSGPGKPRQIGADAAVDWRRLDRAVERHSELDVVAPRRMVLRGVLLERGKIPGRVRGRAGADRLHVVHVAIGLPGDMSGCAVDPTLSPARRVVKERVEQYDTTRKAPALDHCPDRKGRGRCATAISCSRCSTAIAQAAIGREVNMPMPPTLATGKRRNCGSCAGNCRRCCGCSEVTLPWQPYVTCDPPEQPRPDPCDVPIRIATWCNLAIQPRVAAGAPGREVYHADLAGPGLANAVDRRQLRRSDFGHRSPGGTVAAVGLLAITNPWPAIYISSRCSATHSAPA